MFARPFIDSVDFAKNGKELRGETGFSELPRLADILAKTDGVLAYTVRGYHKDDGNMLEFSLQGTCLLRCQRCLEVLDYPIGIVSRLKLLSAEKLAEIGEDEEVEAIEAEPNLDLMALIEDELLLELPFAPKHPEGECASTANDLQIKAKPFAALAELKK